MKKIHLFILLALLIFNCNNIEQFGDDTEETLSTDIKKVNTTIKLPDGTSYSSDDLKVSTLFTDKADVTNGKADVDTFDTSSIELAFATNSQDELVLLSYFDPNEDNEVELTPKTTAIALVMMHPWTFDLTDDAKKQAMDAIETLPEFEPYLKAIENSITSGAVNPLFASEVISEISTLQANLFSRGPSVEKEPLVFEVLDNGDITVKNAKSSAHYSVAIYDEDKMNSFGHQLCKGDEKLHFDFSDIIGQIFRQPQNREAPITLELPAADGDYILIAKSGLSFDDSVENEQAAFYNAKTLAANILGIISSNLKTLLKLDKCYISLGKLIFEGPSNGIGLASSFKDFGNSKITGFQLTQNITGFLNSRFGSVKDVIVDCAKEGIETYGMDKIDATSFGKFLKFIDVLGQIESGANSGVLVFDWIKYSNEVEFCVSKSGDDIKQCETGIDGVWKTEYVSTTICNSVFINNKEWLFETSEEDETKGTISFNFNPNTGDTYENQSFELVGDKLIIDLKTRYMAGPDNVTRTFSFEGDYDDQSNTYEGEFSYEWRHFTTGGQTKRCQGILKITRVE